MKNDPYDAQDAPDRITFSELHETSGDDFALIPDRESVSITRLAISISEISKTPNLILRTMKETIITSDITNIQLSDEYIHIFKDFGYNTDFDCSHLSIDTSKEELETVFTMAITRESTKMGYCTLCNSDLLERARQQNRMYKNGISGFMDRLDDQILTIELDDENGKYEINLCETCWKKHFEKYIQSNEEDYKDEV